MATATLARPVQALVSEIFTIRLELTCPFCGEGIMDPVTGSYTLEIAPNAAEGCITCTNTILTCPDCRQTSRVPARITKILEG